MAGVKEFMNHHFPKVPQEWECERYDMVCSLLAKRQAERELWIRREKLQMLLRRFEQCVQIHQNNRNLFCREEVIRFKDAQRQLNAMGADGMYSHNENVVGHYWYERPGVRPEQFHKLGRINPQWSVPMAKQTDSVLDKPSIYYGVNAKPDPNRPVISFYHKEDGEVRVDVHLPDKMPKDYLPLRTPEKS